MKKISKKKKVILIAVLVAAVLCAVLVYVHNATAVKTQDYVKITETTWISDNKKYGGSIKFNGENIPVYCTSEQFTYLTNPKMFGGDNDSTEKDYYYLIKYKKYRFPSEKAYVLEITDRVDNDTYNKTYDKQTKS